MGPQARRARGWNLPEVIGYNSGVKYTVVIRAGNESGFVATVPALPECVSQGGTRRETLRNVKEAIEARIEVLLEDGVPVQPAAELVEVEVSAGCPLYRVGSRTGRRGRFATQVRW